MSNNKIVTFLTVLTVLIKTIKTVPNAESSTSAPIKTYSQVELSIACNNLPNGDIRSESDPFVNVYEQSLGQDNWILLGKTETIRNNPNPVFQTKVVVTYVFEEKRLLKFDVFDQDKKKCDHLGSVQVALSILTNGRRKTLTLIRDVQKRQQGSIIITALEMGADSGKISLGMSGTNLDKKKVIALGKSGSSPYFEIIKSTGVKENNEEKFAFVFKTEVQKNNWKDPMWPIFEIPVWLLCNGNYEREIKFICHDYNGSNKKPGYIGEFSTTLKELTHNFRNGQPNTFELINMDKKKRDKTYRNSGKIHINHLKIDPVYTFIDYIQGGTQIHATVAIDFTSSNKTNTYNLHEFKPYNYDNLNKYEQAIFSVVSIIEDYDTDKQFPVLGFGASDGSQVYHCFHVNLIKEHPYCQGVKGVFDAYRNCLQNMTLCSPTLYQHVINNVIKQAEGIQVGTGYFILLILTDGDLNDMPETKEAIIRASFLPISIIIVGIGDDSFECVKELAAVDKPLYDRNEQRVRDIVHFVNFNGTANFNTSIGFSPLAKEVLAEIPDQFVAYMKSKNVIPNNKIHRNYYNPDT